MAISRTADRPVLGWAAILTSFGLIGLSVVLLGLAQDDVLSSEESAVALAEGRLLEARRTLELATLEVVVVRMLDGVGVDGDRSDRLASAAADVGSATANIISLAEGEGPVADEANVLLGAVEIEALDAPTESDLSDLFAVAEDTARYGGASEVVTTKRDAIHQLSFVSALPLHVLIEGIAADASVNESAIDPLVAPFVEEMIDVVRTEGGWFGTDSTTPLEGSEWIEIDEGSEMLTAAAARLSNAVAASDLIVYDAWMRELRDGNLIPPFELSEMLSAADELQSELVTTIDQLFLDDEVERVAAVADQEARRGVHLSGAAGTGAFAIAALLFGLLSISRATRASREQAKLAMRDGLTGVGNRHELDERTSALAIDPRFGRHLIAMIDLDSFKIVNDVHGHAAGDAILVEIASRLQQILARVENEQQDVEGSVIRLGGDEFLLTLHAPNALDDEMVRSELDAVRGDSLEHNGEHIGLGFSVGIVLVDGQNELPDLMSAADLAVYEDKAIRARDRGAPQLDPVHPLN